MPMPPTWPAVAAGGRADGSAGSALRRARERLRATGADLPFGDPCGYHGSAMEGYFWRLSLPADSAVIIVMASVNRGADGRCWGTVGMAAHPGVSAKMRVAQFAAGSPRGIGLDIADPSGVRLMADAQRLRVALDAGMEIDARFPQPVAWPRRGLGGLGVAHVVPGLSQYWHPHTMGGAVSGHAVLDGRSRALDGGVVYAEKNWGPRGFPSTWWWGQADTFSAPEVCVAFAGGQVAWRGVHMPATALVVRLGPRLYRAVHPLTPVRVRVGAGRWLVRAHLPGHRIVVEGDGQASPPHRLPIPVLDDRQCLPGAAVHHLAGRLALTVTRGRRTVFAGESRLASLEHGTSAASPADATAARNPTDAQLTGRTDSRRARSSASSSDSTVSATR